MKLILVFMMISLALQTVLANEATTTELNTNVVSTETSYFTKLASMYSSGKLPSLKKISGIAWSGRCFSRNEPNKAKAAGLIYRKKSVKDHGPISLGNYEFTGYSSSIVKPSYFDSIEIEALLDEDVLPSDISKLNFRNVTIEDGSLTTYFQVRKSEFQYDSYVNLRASGKYLVTEYGYRNSDEEVTTRRCYFFIPEYHR